MNAMSECYPFPSDGDCPTLVQIFKQSGDPPFVCGLNGNPAVLDEIEKEYIDNDELHEDLFNQGDGEYLFRVIPQDGQQTFPETGQWDFLPYLELSLVRFRPVPTDDSPVETGEQKTRGSREQPADWQPPETAPRDGTPFLGDFGWPWPCPAVWNAITGDWVISVMQAGDVEGKPDYYFETDSERPHDLKRWMPMPELTGTFN